MSKHTCKQLDQIDKDEAEILRKRGTILNNFMNPPGRKRERRSGKRQLLPDEQTGERQEQKSKKKRDAKAALKNSTENLPRPPGR